MNQTANESIRVRQGEIFEVSLREQAATGHRWRLADAPAQVVLVDERYEPPRRGGPIGSAGRRLATLRATGRGHHRLRFELVRPSETEPAAEHVVEVEAV